tara:strand:+ start:3003 stop:6149 length:3147 start_codon:yes stop_codon:yes gene_type:complete
MTKTVKPNITGSVTEKDTLLQILNSKVVLYKDLIKRTYVCYKSFISNNIFKMNEIINGLNELESIKNKLFVINNEINEENVSVDEIIEKLQEINDNLSLTIKNYGSESINDMMIICFGSDYLNKNVLLTNDVVNFYNFLDDSSNVLNYEVVNICESDNLENNNSEIITVKNIDIETSTFFIKINGFKIIINYEDSQKIIINCVFKDIPVSYYLNSIISDKLTNIKLKKPNNDNFKKRTFNNFIESLSLKNIIVYSVNEIYELYLSSLSNATVLKSKLLSKLMRDFTSNDLFIQRQILIDLLLNDDDYEGKYIAYLLYDMLSTDINNNLDTKEQLIIYNSFPSIIQKNFKNAMKTTIEYTKQLMESDLENKLPLEQRICLMKTSDSVKEKAMMKVKELKSKSDDSSSKVRNYLEGLLKIPFGIFKREPILCIMESMIKVLKKSENKDNKYLNIDNKEPNNIDIMKIYHKSSKLIKEDSNEELNNLIDKLSKIEIDEKINKYNTKHNSDIKIYKTLKKTRENLKNILQTNEDELENFKILFEINNIPEEVKYISSEFSKINNYLEYIDKTLDDSIYGHYEAKVQIKRVIGQWINGKDSGYCFGFEGPPGVGKTSIAKNGIAKCLKDDSNEDRPFGFIAIGGSSNGSTLDGHNYTYVGSTWGKIVDILIESKCMNPIIFIDEIDKVSKTESGKELIGILTHLIDPSQNEKFQDKYFTGIDLDLSKVLFIFSYNDVELMDSILLDRIHRVRFKYLSKADKLIITKKFIIPELCCKMGYCSNSVIDINNELIEYIIDEYTSEAGVRKLKEILFEIISEINLRLLSGEILSYPVVVKKDDLVNIYLRKRHPINPKNIHKVCKCGIINGLWANALGRGGIIQIESQFILSNNMFDLKLTGMQGDVMKESMNVAKTLAWKLTCDDNRKKLIEQFDKTKTQGIHIHCPEGAVPKDGPSAGTAITVCLYSLFNDIPINNKIAITGEITLQGEVTAIGGLDLKITGGIKAGVTTFLYPKENSKDFIDFINESENKEICKDITFIEIENISEALEYALVK